MICPQCRSTELTESRENHHYRESGLHNVTLCDLTVRRCPHCGVSFAAIPRLAELHRTLALALLTKPQRLVPSEIRFLRKHLGWSGADFARKLHCSPAQVSRWESEVNPVPMSNAYELLLRTLVALGEKVEDYAERIETIATGSAAPPAVMQMVCADDGWKQAA